MDLSAGRGPSQGPVPLQEDPQASMKALVGGICHRAKNDLQTIANILSLAGPLTGSPEALAEAVEGRVVALSLCYGLVAERWAPPTLDRLADEVLRRSLWRVSGQARVERRLAPVQLSMRLCSPLSLWLHEVIGNALEHGLGAVSRPLLGLSGGLDQGGLVIEVADNGPGLPPGFDPERGARLGLKLARAVAQTDLRGRMDLLDGGPGMVARLWVPGDEFAALNREVWR